MLAVGVLVVAGWPLLNSLLGPGTDALRNGERLTLGSGSGTGSGSGRVRFAVGPGWTLRKSGSDPAQRYRLERRTVKLTIALVTPPAGTTPAQLWAGLRNTARIAAPDAVLGEPSPYRDGLRGSIEQGGETGVATVLPGPGDDPSVETTALGSPGSAADRAAADDVVASIRFEAADR